MRLALIDIDTSHPAAWIPLLRQMGHEVVAIWDGGTVHAGAYVRQFAAEHEIPTVAERLEDLVEAADGAIVHSCNWDIHIQRAAPFVAAGKPVLIDKPMAGCLRDLRQLLAWAQEGKRIAGGSSLRVTGEAEAFVAQPAADRGDVRIVLAGCGTDEFNYGIHAYSMLWSIMGPGAIAARWVCDQPQWQVEVIWNDGRRGLVSMGGDQGWLPFYATVVTDKTVHHLVPATDTLYKALLVKFMPYMEGQVAEPVIPMPQLIEPELAAVAALESRRLGGQMVRLDDLSDEAGGYDGAAFAAEYKKQRGT